MHSEERAVEADKKMPERDLTKHYGTIKAVDNGAIYARISAVMDDIEAIGKDRDNKQQGYKFRGIDDVYNMLHGILAKHKVFTVPRITNSAREERTTKSGSVLIYSILDIEFDFYTDDGSYIVVGPLKGEGMDSGDKASNKAMSVAHKYALLQVFAIPTVDDKDPENENHDLSPRGGAPVPPKTKAAPKTTQPKAPPPKAATTPPPVQPKGAPPNRDVLNRQLMNLYRPYLSLFPETKFVELLQGRYNVGETRLMSVEQIQDLVKFMETRLKSGAENPHAGNSTASNTSQGSLHGSASTPPINDSGAFQGEPGPGDFGYEPGSNG